MRLSKEHSWTYNGNLYLTLDVADSKGYYSINDYVHAAIQEYYNTNDFMPSRLCDKIEVNPAGEVRSRSNHKPYSTSMTAQGYAKVSVMIDGKATDYLVHRLVASTFDPDWSEDKVVDHIDGRKTNNQLSNLRCVYQVENCLYRDANHKQINNEINRLIQMYGYDALLEKLKAL